MDGAAVDAEAQVVPFEAVGETSLRLGVQTPLGLVVADRRERAFVDLDDRAAGPGEGAELRVECLGQAERQHLSRAHRRDRRAGRCVYGPMSTCLTAMSVVPSAHCQSSTVIGVAPRGGLVEAGRVHGGAVGQRHEPIGARASEPVDERAQPVLVGDGRRR